MIDWRAGLVHIRARLLGANPNDVAKLFQNYPREDRVTLFRDVLGGGFVDLINDPNYENTCAIRLSVAFNRSGLPIPKSIWTSDGKLKDKNASSILIKVPSALALLANQFGEPYWGLSKKVGVPFDFQSVPKVRGVISYRANFPTATGHIDLWDSNSCVYGCPPVDVSEAYDVSLWK